MTKTILKIDGMACGMCEAHINDCIRQNFSIKKIKTSHKEGKAEIVSELPLNKEKLQKVVSDTGYTIMSIQSELYENKHFRGK